MCVWVRGCGCVGGGGDERQQGGGRQAQAQHQHQQGTAAEDSSSSDQRIPAHTHCCTVQHAALHTLWYLSEGLSALPEMMSGVRASSMRIESTSSMTQKLKGRSTSSSAPCARLSRR